MFRALTCPSSGGKIVLSQHLVSSLSSGILYCTAQRVTIADGVIIQFVLLQKFYVEDCNVTYILL